MIYTLINENKLFLIIWLRLQCTHNTNISYTIKLQKFYIHIAKVISLFIQSNITLSSIKCKKIFHRILFWIFYHHIQNKSQWKPFYSDRMICLFLFAVALKCIKIRDWIINWTQRVVFLFDWSFWMMLHFTLSYLRFYSEIYCCRNNCFSLYNWGFYQ